MVNGIGNGDRPARIGRDDVEMPNRASVQAAHLIEIGVVDDDVGDRSGFWSPTFQPYFFSSSVLTSAGSARRKGIQTVESDFENLR